MRSEEASSRKLGRRAAKGLFKGGGTSVFLVLKGFRAVGFVVLELLLLAY